MGSDPGCCLCCCWGLHEHLVEDTCLLNIIPRLPMVGNLQLDNRESASAVVVTL